MFSFVIDIEKQKMNKSKIVCKTVTYTRAGKCTVRHILLFEIYHFHFVFFLPFILQS